MSTPEGRIVERILSALRSRERCWYVKVHGGIYQSAGIPDIIGCDSGRFVGIEVKQPGHKPTKLQELVIRRIEAAGGIVGVATSVDEALEIVESTNETTR